MQKELDYEALRIKFCTHNLCTAQGGCYGCRVDEFATYLAKVSKEPEDALPKVGDVIYIPSSISIDHGWDDVRGGKASILEVKVDKNAPEVNSVFLRVAQSPDRSYNWHSLKPQQEKLQKEFGDNWAYPDPDGPMPPWIQPYREGVSR